ncbi:MAG: ABC transporter ATP-binding protein, partial [Acidimicrobiia bacterium]|nr:ABC transporter ATP-binding protein [Acidimicrobiia bacterium]
MAASTTIVAKGLTKRYGDLTAVDHLDLEVDTGEVFGLLGPNGAGKTTTILMLLGLSEPSEGTVQVAGLDPTRKPLDVKRIVGYLPDNVGFYDSLTGRQNLRYTARLNSLPKEASERRIAALLTEVGLAEAGDAPAGTYS